MKLFGTFPGARAFLLIVPQRDGCTDLHRPEVNPRKAEPYTGPLLTSDESRRYGVVAYYNQCMWLSICPGLGQLAECQCAWDRQVDAMTVQAWLQHVVRIPLAINREQLAHLQVYFNRI